MDLQNVLDGSVKLFCRFLGNSEGVVSCYILLEGRVEVKKESFYVCFMFRDCCIFVFIGLYKYVFVLLDLNFIYKDCSFKELLGVVDFRELLWLFLVGVEEDRWGLD